MKRQYNIVIADISRDIQEKSRAENVNQLYTAVVAPTSF